MFSVSGVWYAEGLRFACNLCGVCCRGDPGYVWVGVEEAGRIAAWLGMPFRAFAAAYLRKVGLRLSLRELPNGDCVFYHDGCSIYRVRPRQCVTYPFWAEHVRSQAAWERLKEQCPGAGAGQLYSSEEIQRLVGEAERARAEAGLGGPWG